MLKNLFSLALKIGLSAGLIWWATRNLDFGEAAQRIVDIPLWIMIGAAITFLAALANNTARWQVVMRAVAAKLSFTRALLFLYVGIFFNQVLPSSVGGDAVRIFLVYKDGHGLRAAINGILLERVATLMGLIVLVVATQPFIWARLGDDPTRWVFPLMGVGGVVGIGILMLMDRFPARMQAWRVIQAISTVAEDSRRLFLVPRYGFTAILMGVVGFTLLSSVSYLLAIGLNINITLLDCLVLIPPVFLITTIPISIAGWGVREAAMVFALGLVGVDADSAVLLSLLLGLFAFIISLPGAVLWLRTGYSRSQVAAEVPTE